MTLKVRDIMGKVVIVDYVFNRVHPMHDLPGRYTQVWKACPAVSRPGWVVGERWLQDGAAFFRGDEGSVWESDGHTVHCLLVCYWPTMKPVRVPLDGYCLASLTIRPYPPQPSWSTRDRNALRREVKNWPRDKKGRWTGLIKVV